MRIKKWFKDWLRGLYADETDTLVALAASLSSYQHQRRVELVEYLEERRPALEYILPHERVVSVGALMNILSLPGTIAWVEVSVRMTGLTTITRTAIWEFLRTSTDFKATGYSQTEEGFICEVQSGITAEMAELYYQMRPST